MQETFLVKLLCRQNATWQGTVDWIDSDGQTRVRSFRSALELIRLIDSAGGGVDTPGWDSSG